MRKKLIEALATKFEGVDAKVFKRIADNILSRKTIESDEDVESAVEEVTFKDVLESYGDARATEAAATARRKALLDSTRKRSTKKGGANDDDTDDDDDDDPNPDDDDKVVAAVKKLFGGLEEKLTSVQSKIDAIEKGKLTDGRKAKVDALLKGLTEAERRPYARIKVEDMSDEDFTSFLDEVKADAKTISEAKRQGGSSFFAPLGGEHEGGTGGEIKEASDADIEAAVSQMRL